MTDQPGSLFSTPSAARMSVGIPSARVAIKNGPVAIIFDRDAKICQPVQSQAVRFRAGGHRRLRAWRSWQLAGTPCEVSSASGAIKRPTDGVNLESGVDCPATTGPVWRHTDQRDTRLVPKCTMACEISRTCWGPIHLVALAHSNTSMYRVEDASGHDTASGHSAEPFGRDGGSHKECNDLRSLLALLRLGRVKRPGCGERLIEGLRFLPVSRYASVERRWATFALSDTLFRFDGDVMASCHDLGKTRHAYGQIY